MIENLYSKIGEENLRVLVEHFYNEVLDSPIIAPLFTGDIGLVKEKQFTFLTQFLGGPTLYSEQFGQPRMRMRHLPHKIDEDAMFEWLRCMKKAISQMPVSEQIRIDLYAVFPKLAMHMVNS